MPWTNHASGTTLAATGTATAPGAGAAIATLAAPPRGTYAVTVAAGFGAGAAPAAAENNNMQLKAGGTVVATLVIPGAIVTPVMTGCALVVVLDGATALTVNAIGAGTALVVYLAGIYATRLDG